MMQWLLTIQLQRSGFTSPYELVPPLSVSLHGKYKQNKILYYNSGPRSPELMHLKEDSRTQESQISF